jgi:Cu-Zn family superoxide dismutase
MNRFLAGALMMALTSPAWALTGTAEVRGTATNSPIRGTAQFQDTPSGLSMKVQLVGMAPGTHGIHIHEFGACENMAKGAGAHYNPLGKNHGDVTKNAQQAHAGDTGNIVAQENGSATLTVTIPGVTLASGKHTVAGRALVVHEKADDFTSQPAGNAGERIACGPILLTGSDGK